MLFYIFQLILTVLWGFKNQHGPVLTKHSELFTCTWKEILSPTSLYQSSIKNSNRLWMPIIHQYLKYKGWKFTKVSSAMQVFLSFKEDRKKSEAVDIIMICWTVLLMLQLINWFPLSFLFPWKSSDFVSFPSPLSKSPQNWWKM